MGRLRGNQMLPGSFEGRPAAEIAARRREERRRGREGIWPSRPSDERGEESSDNLEVGG
jgi:hypothetical protein